MYFTTEQKRRAIADLDNDVVFEEVRGEIDVALPLQPLVTASSTPTSSFEKRRYFVQAINLELHVENHQGRASSITPTSRSTPWIQLNFQRKVGGKGTGTH